MITASTLYLLLINIYGLSPIDSSVMTCIAYHESKFSPQAIHVNNNGTQDTGIFQINDVNLKLCKITREELKDPHKNIQCAMKILEEQDFKAWTTLRKCIK